jgi:catechol 2,3-dioxygenase-like lactoylglutathione lyase family enzyme
MKLAGFNHVTIRVKDLRRSLAFYRDVLGMTVVHLGRTDAYLDGGGAWVCLVEKAQSDFPSDTAPGVDHVAFSIAESDFDDAVEQLKRHGVTIVRGPILRGQGWTVNFLDPDGTQLELHTSNLAERMEVWK